MITNAAGTMYKGSKHHLRVDLHVVTEADIVDDMASELRPVKGSQSTQAAIDCDVLSRQDILVLGCHLIGDLHVDTLLLDCTKGHVT